MSQFLMIIVVLKMTHFHKGATIAQHKSMFLSAFINK